MERPWKDSWRFTPIPIREPLFFAFDRMAPPIAPNVMFDVYANTRIVHWFRWASDELDQYGQPTR